LYRKEFNAIVDLGIDHCSDCSLLGSDIVYEYNIKLDILGVQEVRWEGGGTESVGEYTFFYGKGKENISS
jgi:hypothetical protein